MDISSWYGWLSNPEAWVTLITLTVLEIVLGIDNVIFLTILVNRLPKAMQQKARLFGLGLAMFTRIILLLSITWVMSLTQPLFELAGHAFSGRDIILIAGGLFLLYKSGTEIFNMTERPVEALEDEIAEDDKAISKGLVAIVIQIAVIDIVFSLDSVITAVGLSNNLPVMIMAVMAAVAVMMFAARPIGEFVEEHPSIQTLALGFLIMVGGVLIADGLGQPVDKNYLYVAMVFSLVTELINIRRRKNEELAETTVDIPGIGKS